MEFDLIRYYDTCCDVCGTWATTNIRAAELCKNKKHASKILYEYGWRIIKGKTVCSDCIDKKFRIFKGDKYVTYNFDTEQYE